MDDWVRAIRYGVRRDGDQGTHGHDDRPPTDQLHPGTITKRI